MFVCMDCEKEFNSILDDDDDEFPLCDSCGGETIVVYGTDSETDVLELINLTNRGY